MIPHWELVHHYLHGKGLQITNGPAQALVHLNEEVDRKFMNRPFYWHYRDATNQKGEPMTISVIKEEVEPLPPNAIKASPLNPIFNQLIQAAHEETRWFKAYETVKSPSTNYAPLYPWITIQGQLSIDPPGSATHWIEAAISLTTGAVRTGNQLFLYAELKPELPNQHVTMASVIQYERAIQTLLVKLEQVGKQLFQEDLNHAHNRFKK